MPAKIIAHPSIADRRAKGADARIATPPASHTGWVPAADRADPVTLLSDQNVTREQDLVPVRHGRMMVSPFTFYRGAAKIMAADLAGDPDRRADRAALRGRAPVELRRVRLARAAAAVRPERLRRDPARAVRVRRQADGRELHHRRPEQRDDAGRGQGRHHGVRPGLPGGDGRVRPDGHHGPVVRPHVRGRPERGDRASAMQGHDASSNGKSQPRARTKCQGRRRRTRRRARPARNRSDCPPTNGPLKTAREGAAQGAHQGQPAGPVEAG